MNENDSKTPNDMTSIGMPAILKEENLAEFEMGLKDEEVLSHLPANSALLIVKNGETAGSRYLINKDETLIGRSEKADIMLDDPPVSRKHARIIRRGEMFEIEDSGSLNGTYLNGEILKAPQPLKSQDILQFGKSKLVFIKK